MHNLKKHNVPFRERFRHVSEHLEFVLVCILFLPFLPIVVIWAFLHESGEGFLHGVKYVIMQRCELMEKQRADLIRKYSKD
jgi:hypothetical protein